MSKILFYNNIERINWQVKKTVYNNRYSLDPKIISKITSFDPSYLVKEKAVSGSLILFNILISHSCK